MTEIKISEAQLRRIFREEVERAMREREIKKVRPGSEANGAKRPDAAEERLKKRLKAELGLP